MSIVRTVRPGLYRHFKGGIYIVYDVATHTETDEQLVVYSTCKTDEHRLFVRPIEMFLSPVDREKYPDAKQDMRFEFLGEYQAAEMHLVVEHTCHFVLTGSQGNQDWECDRCGAGFDWDDMENPPSCSYCPSCGARVVNG